MQYKNYFQDNIELLEKLENLHQKKYELKKQIEENKLKGNCSTFIVEFSGLPRTGKTVTLDRIYEFFKQANISIEKTEEPAQIIKNQLSKSEVLQLSDVQFNDTTLRISREELKRKKEKNPSIIIEDRGVIDNYFWYQMLYEEGKIRDDFYEKILLQLANDILDVDLVFILVAKPEIIVFRDYINQIYLEDRKKTTIERVTKLRKGFEHLLQKMEKTSIGENKIIKMDTSNMQEIDTSIWIADKMVDSFVKKLSL